MDDTAQKTQATQAQQAKPDYQQMYGAGGKFKEQLEAIAKSWTRATPEASAGKEREVTAVEEIPVNVEEEKLKEAEGYIEKVEKEAELAKPVLDDYTQQVLVAPAAAQKPKVTLPLTDDQIQTGLHHKVYDAIRWLAEWCVRQIKMFRKNQ